MNRTFRVLLAAATLLVPSRPAAAQEIDSPFRFQDHSMYAGLRIGQVSTDEGRIGGGPQSGLMVGAEWAIRITGPFVAGVEIGFMPTTRTVRDTAFSEADSVFAAVGEADSNVLLALANLRFNVTGPRTWHALQPFLLLGAGAALDIAGDAEADAEVPATARFDFGTSFAGQMGAGVEWFPSDRIGVRVDARNVLWRLQVPDAFVLTEQGRTLPGSEWEQNYLVSAGISVHF